jgi:hypothetical protein
MTVRGVARAVRRLGVPAVVGLWVAAWPAAGRGDSIRGVWEWEVARAEKRPADDGRGAAAPLPGANGLLAGQVVDPSRRPLAKACIQVIGLNGPMKEPRLEVETREDGYFTIPGLQPGRHYLVIARVKDGERRLSGTTTATPPNPRLSIVLGEEKAEATEPPGRPRSEQERLADEVKALRQALAQQEQKVDALLQTVEELRQELRRSPQPPGYPVLPSYPQPPYYVLPYYPGYPTPAIPLPVDPSGRIQPLSPGTSPAAPKEGTPTPPLSKDK